MKIKFLTILFCAIISLTLFSCEKNYEEMSDQDRAKGERVCFCKTFDHSIDLKVKLFSESRPREITIKENCICLTFPDSVESVTVIDKYDDDVEIIDDDVNSTRMTVKYGFLNLFQNEIGAAIYMDLQKPPDGCDCIPVSEEAVDTPGTAAQKVKAVYMQDM